MKTGERIHEHMTAETEALRAQAKRARLFDHRGNRGAEVEFGILRWLGERFAPDYRVSSGEIVDSFDTNAERDNRQQDGVLHRNGPDANRFLLPSGMRLLPVETVAAVVEVKLTLDKKEFFEADGAATETARLRMRGQLRTSMFPGPTSLRHMSEEEIDAGTPLDHPEFEAHRPAFAVFGFGGVSKPETLIDWLREANTITVVCCLDAGCVFRGGLMHTGHRNWHVTQREHALESFAQQMRNAIDRHGNVWQHFRPNFGYYAKPGTMRFWDETRSYEPPTWYKGTPAEAAQRAELYRARKSLDPACKARRRRRS